MLTTCEYIWIDGTQPTPRLRSKMRFVDVRDHRDVRPGELPTWSFDGSSTYQASGSDSDLLLEPVRIERDPIRGSGLLVLCEVKAADGTPHSTNERAVLRSVLDAGARGPRSRGSASNRSTP